MDWVTILRSVRTLNVPVDDGATSLVFALIDYAQSHLGIALLESVPLSLIGMNSGIIGRNTHLRGDRAKVRDLDLGYPDASEEKRCSIELPDRAG